MCVPDTNITYEPHIDLLGMAKLLVEYMRICFGSTESSNRSILRCFSRPPLSLSLFLCFFLFSFSLFLSLPRSLKRFSFLDRCPSPQPHKLNTTWFLFSSSYSHRFHSICSICCNWQQYPKSTKRKKPQRFRI